MRGLQCDRHGQRRQLRRWERSGRRRTAEIRESAGSCGAQRALEGDGWWHGGTRSASDGNGQNDIGVKSKKARPCQSVLDLTHPTRELRKMIQNSMDRKGPANSDRIHHGSEKGGHCSFLGSGATSNRGGLTAQMEAKTRPAATWTATERSEAGRWMWTADFEFWRAIFSGHSSGTRRNHWRVELCLRTKRRIRRESSGRHHDDGYIDRALMTTYTETEQLGKEVGFLRGKTSQTKQGRRKSSSAPQIADHAPLSVQRNAATNPNAPSLCERTAVDGCTTTRTDVAMPGKGTGVVKPPNDALERRRLKATGHDGAAVVRCCASAGV